MNLLSHIKKVHQGREICMLSLAKVIYVELNTIFGGLTKGGVDHVVFIQNQKKMF